MKTSANIFYTGVVWMLFLMAIGGCKDTGLSEGSYLNTTPPPSNSLDNWIQANYTDPYNIEVVYRWTESLVDTRRYSYPPTLDKVQPALETVKKLWIEPYSSMSPYIVNKAAPRQIVLVGGKNMEPSGSTTLGMAEGGKRITLFEIDLLKKDKRGQTTQFIHTIQHEYVHILNQTKPFDEQNYGKITRSGYLSQWYNESDEASLKAGFITAYSRANESEDFAEMTSSMLDMNNAEWNKFLDKTGKKSLDFKNGVDLIRQKEEFVVRYYKEAFGIDFYQLQEAVYQATLKL